LARLTPLAKQSLRFTSLSSASLLFRLVFSFVSQFSATNRTNCTSRPSHRSPKGLFSSRKHRAERNSQRRQKGKTSKVGEQSKSGRDSLCFVDFVFIFLGPFFLKLWLCFGLQSSARTFKFDVQRQLHARQSAGDCVRQTVCNTQSAVHSPPQTVWPAHSLQEAICKKQRSRDARPQCESLGLTLNGVRFHE